MFAGAFGFCQDWFRGAEHSVDGRLSPLALGNMTKPHQFTRPIDWAASPLVRRFGVRCARRFYVIWGIGMYSLLIGFSAPLVVALSQLSEARPRSLIVYSTVGLIVAGASLLARMLGRIFRELRDLEARQR